MLQVINNEMLVDWRLWYLVQYNCYCWNLLCCHQWTFSLLWEYHFLKRYWQGKVHFFSRSRLSSRDICWKGRRVWEVIGKGDFLYLTTLGLCITTETKVPNQWYVCVIVSLKHLFGIILPPITFLPGFAKFSSVEKKIWFSIV